MRRDQLEHAIRTACQIIGHPAVIIVGSHAILGSFGEDELPVEPRVASGDGAVAEVVVEWHGPDAATVGGADLAGIGHRRPGSSARARL